jgi:hypothetical protein
MHLYLVSWQELPVLPRIMDGPYAPWRMKVLDRECMSATDVITTIQRRGNPGTKELALLLGMHRGRYAFYPVRTNQNETLTIQKQQAAKLRGFRPSDHSKSTYFMSVARKQIGGGH